MHVAELVSIVNKSTGLRHVFLGNIFWYAKENTAIFVPNSFCYSLDCKFVSLYIVLSAHQCMHISVNNSALQNHMIHFVILIWELSPPSVSLSYCSIRGSISINTEIIAHHQVSCLHLLFLDRERIVKLTYMRASQLTVCVINCNLISDDVY